MARWGLIELQNRLCGALLCSKNNTFLSIICILDSFGPSYDVEAHFKPPLRRFSVPYTKCYIFPTKNRFLLMKNGGYPEVRLARRSLIELQNRLCGPLLCSKNITFLYIICIVDRFRPSHEVESHFKPQLRRFPIAIFPFM